MASSGGESWSKSDTPASHYYVNNVAAGGAGAGAPSAATTSRTSSTTYAPGPVGTNGVTYVTAPMPSAANGATVQQQQHQQYPQDYPQPQQYYYQHQQQQQPQQYQPPHHGPPPQNDVLEPFFFTEREQARQRLKNYVRLGKIGEGTYGKVYRSRNIATGISVQLEEEKKDARCVGSFCSPVIVSGCSICRQKRPNHRSVTRTSAGTNVDRNKKTHTKKQPISLAGLGMDVALKCIQMDTHDEGTPSTALREISILKFLVHPNIVKLHEVQT